MKSPAVLPVATAASCSQDWRAFITTWSAKSGVRWLRAMLAKLAGEPVDPAASTYYDAALERRVRAYQRAHQLTVDGIVGARTQIAMVAELGLPGTPSLVTEH